MEGKDFVIWVFAAIMVLSPMAMAASTKPYRGEALATAPANAPATSGTNSTTAATPKP